MLEGSWNGKGIGESFKNCTDIFWFRGYCEEGDCVGWIKRNDRADLCDGGHLLFAVLSLLAWRKIMC